MAVLAEQTDENNKKEHKRGRPHLSEGKKEINFKLRFDAETLALLNRCAKELNVTRSTFIREAIRYTAKQKGIN